MATTRREFLARAGTTAAAAGMTLALPAWAKAAAEAGLHLGVCDWSIGARGQLKAFDIAAEIGLEGVQISPRAAAENLTYSDPKVQDQYRQAVKKTGLKIASVGLTVTNGCPLATDKRGVSWLIQTADAAAALGCTATLVAFFGRGDLRAKGKGKGPRPLNKAAVDNVVAKLKEAAPHAATKGVALGLENTLSAKQNMQIIDRVGSEAVTVYYDIANSTANGYDVPAEIRMLKGRICEFHFKNTKGVFGESGVTLEPIVKAVLDIGYKGWLVMERCFGKDKVAYFRQNAAVLRKMLPLPKAPKAS